MPNDQSLDVTGELTISAWIKPYSFGGSNWGLIDRGGYSQYQLKVDTGGRAVSSLWHNGARRDYCYGVGDGAPLNGWSHVLITYDGVGTVESYLDGIHQCSHTQNEGAIDSKVTTLNIGRASSYYWDGLLDDVRIYNRALSGEEVNLLYESYRPQATQGSINQGLIGYWPLTSTWTKGGSAGSEIVTDRTPYSNDGQNSGATLTGEGAIFGGSGHNINMGDDVILRVTENFSVSIWVKTSMTSSSNQYFMARWDSTNSKRVWGIILRGNNDYASIITSLTGAGGIQYLNGITRINDGDWHLVTFVHDGTDLILYVDGEEDNRAGRDSLFSTDTSLLIGRSNTFNGELRGARIYDRALSGEEVKLLYELGW